MSILSTLQAQVLNDSGGHTLAVQIDIHMFNRIIEELEDLEDIRSIDAAAQEPVRSLTDAIQAHNW